MHRTYFFRIHSRAPHCYVPFSVFIHKSLYTPDHCSMFRDATAQVVCITGKACYPYNTSSCDNETLVFYDHNVHYCMIELMQCVAPTFAFCVCSMWALFQFQHICCVHPESICCCPPLCDDITLLVPKTATGFFSNGYLCTIADTGSRGQITLYRICTQIAIGLSVSVWSI